MSINPFANTKTASNAVVEPSTGGNTFAVPPTGAYKATMQYAYMRQNQNKPQNLDIHFQMTLDNGFKWEIIAYGVLVNGSPYTQKPGEEPKLTYGFNTATRIMMMFANKTLEDAANNMSDKIVEIFNFEARKGVPTTVNVFNDTVGKEAWVGLTRKIVNKKQLVDGAYVPLPERKQEAVLSTMATVSTGQTYTELLANEPPAKFQEWINTSANKDWDTYTPVANVPQGSTGSIPATGKPMGNPISF